MSFPRRWEAAFTFEVQQFIRKLPTKVGWAKLSAVQQHFES